MAETFAQQVRQVASELGEFTVDDLVSRVPVSTYKEKKKVRSVAQGFEKSGEITLLGPGLYRYQAKQTPLSKVARMWRAMKIKGYFTRQDLVKLCGASEGHVEKYVYFLKRGGFIAHVAGQGYEHALYCLIDPENAPLKHPEMPGQWV